MALQKKVLFIKDCVFIHNCASDASEKNAHIPGRICLHQKADGHYLEWEAEELVRSESHLESDWAVIGDASYDDEEVDTELVNTEMEAWRKHNISFDLLNLKSVKHHSPNRGLAYVIFVLKDGRTFPPLYFHGGGSEALLKEIEKVVVINMSSMDPELFLVQEHDPDMLTRSLDELQLFSESSAELVSNFIRDPYTATLGSFSKVTNFLRDILLSEDPPENPSEEVLLQDIPRMKDHPEEQGFGVITKTVLSPRSAAERGEPLSADEWASHFDADGRMRNVDHILKTIFRGGIDPAIRTDVWKYLLGYYSWDSTQNERQQKRKEKVNEYFCMKRQWKTFTPEQVQNFSVLRNRKALIEKDVHRTDREEKLFKGDKNPNVQVMNDILMTYGMYNFDLGYVQGMSDMLSPLMAVMENEVDTFWCFVGLMERMGHNFELDQACMMEQLEQIQRLVQFYDPELYAYFDSHESGKCYFCFRWILIHFKREFAFDKIPDLWEVLWTNLPCRNFHLLFTLAILHTEKATFMDNKFGFNEILKHINDSTNTIPLEEMLCKAEGISQQMMQCQNLPPAIKEILGPIASSSSTSSTSSKSLECPG